MFSFAVYFLAFWLNSSQAVAQPAAEPAPKPAEPARRSTIGGAMEIMDRALEKLQVQIEDAAKKQENLALVNELERGCVISKGHSLPQEFLDQVGGAEAQAELKRVYYNDLFDLLKRLVLLEEAINSGTTETAKQRLIDVMAARDEGHKHMEHQNDNPFGGR